MGESLVTRCLLILSFCIITACEGRDKTAFPSTEEAEKQTKKLIERTRRVNNLFPCKLLNAAMIQSALNLSMTPKINDISGAETCRYYWMKANIDEINKANNKLMEDFHKLRKKNRQEGKPMPGTPELIGLDAKVFIVIEKLPDATTAAQKFDKKTEALHQGIKAESERIDSRLDANYDKEISGIGDEALWSSQSKQLHVRKGDLFIYLFVDTELDLAKDLENAKILMFAVLAKL
jgi:hypothetical protein